MAPNDYSKIGMEEAKLNEWRESRKAILGRFHAHSEPFRISNVPEQLREVNRNAYMPKAISIGPRYKGARSDLLQWDKIKCHCMQSLLHRGPTRSVETKLHECTGVIAGLEKEIRASYADDLKLEWNDLANIMLCDACFLLELLISGSKDLNERLKSRVPPGPEVRRKEEVVTGAEVVKKEEVVTGAEIGKRKEVVTDLMVLENQIPLIILHKLSEQLFDEVDVVPVETLALNLFGYFPDKSFKYFIADIASRHFLELVHSYVSEDGEEKGTEQAQERQHASIPIDQLQAQVALLADQSADYAVSPLNVGADVDEVGVKEALDEIQGSLHVSEAISSIRCFISRAKLNRCAPVLQVAGVTIRTPTPGTGKKLDDQGQGVTKGFNFCIKFNKDDGTLEIPQLHITKSTEVMWRNLIAWEQGHTGCSCKHKCTWAAFFFNGLICCESDVQLLKDKHVIVDHLEMGNRKLLEFFRSIINGVDCGKTCDSPYWGMVSDLNSYSGACCLRVKRYSIILWHSWLPKALRHIDRYVLRGYNLLIGMISLYALMQTIYTILSYYHN